MPSLLPRASTRSPSRIPTLLRAALVTTASLVLLLPARALPAQSTLRATRVELEERAAAFERAAIAEDSSHEARGRAERNAARLRERLRDGDFQVGDRVVLVVTEDAALSDTFTVGLGRALQLAKFGTVPLQGVLRAELETRLREALGRYFRDPQVTATALVRVGVLGAVSRPGYYPISPDVVLSDVVAQAGGPASNAELSRTVVRRGTRELWNEEDLRLAMRQGRTLDDMSLVAGDEIVIGARRRSPWPIVLQTTTALVAVVGVVMSLSRN